MHKLKLNLDELRVEQFATIDTRLSNEGTVHGNAATLICSEKRSCGHVCP